jgi:6-phosphogluconolactonase/glucosamine-6-phosphate isomerase/deaminase
MELIRINSIHEGAEPLADRLTDELTAGKKVLWLVSGGSNIPLSVEVMNRIPVDLTNALTIFLTDERYGEVGHADSNSKQLDDAGIDHKNARVTYVLSKGMSLIETCDQYSLAISAAFEVADIVIGQFGMGPDGHILGILPGTPAVDSEKLVVGYETEQFTRITLSAKAVQDNVDAAYVFAFGDNKKDQLLTLTSKDLPVDEQPAQLLKSLPEAYVYNDQIAN